MMARSYSNAGAFNPGPGAPEPPPKFTEGIPDVQSIERQKAAYNKSLDDQLHQGVQVLTQQNKQRKAYLNQVADQQKNQFNLQVDQQLRAQEMALDQQYNHQLMTLQQAAHEQKSVLEAQANTLSLEYQQKKAQEDFNFQQYTIQKQHHEAQTNLNQELAKIQQQERETAIPHAFLVPPTQKIGGSFVPPATGPLQSYTPPPLTTVVSRPSFSYAPAPATVTVASAAPAHTTILMGSSTAVPSRTFISS